MPLLRSLFCLDISQTLDVDFSIETVAAAVSVRSVGYSPSFLIALDGLVARLRFDHAFLFTLAVE